MRKFRRGWPAEIRRFVERAAWESTATAATVIEDLDARFPGEVLPTERTLRDWLKDLRRDPTEPWTLGEEENPEDVAFLLRIQAAALERFPGQTQGLTIADAQWLLRLKAACEGLSDSWRYLLVRWLINEAVPLAMLQGFLAFRPWLSEGDSDRYWEAVRAGGIPAPSAEDASVWLKALTMHEAIRDGEGRRV